MRLQGNNAQKPQNVYSFDLTFSPMIHMTSFLFHAGSWALRDATFYRGFREPPTSNVPTWKNLGEHP